MISPRLNVSVYQVLTKNAAIAIRIDAAPSIKKNHCQAWRLAIPSMLCRIPAARKPEMMLEMVLPACHIAMRIGFSSLVYHDEVMSVIPGKKGASVRPMKNRQIQKPTPLYFC